MPLTPNTIQELMQLITITALGLDPTQQPSFAAVRVSWQQQGQPSMAITDDVAFIHCVEEDDEYNRIRDQMVTDIAPEPSTQVTLTDQYTRVWRTYWTIYGPNSFDNARKIRSSLFSQAIHDLILNGSTTPAVAGAPLYLVTNAQAPRRVPELADAQWWERTDFDCQFNEFVSEDVVVNAVKSTAVAIEKTTYVPCP